MLAFLGDAKFYELVLRFDSDIAEAVRAQRCPRCGGVLHRADYPRKPRGVPDRFEWAFRSRMSLCCSVEGCRGRRTPGTVRFLGRRIYVGAVIVLICALRSGISRRRFRRLRRLFGVSRSTLERWRRWWREVFPTSAFWQMVCGQFVPPVESSSLVHSLWARFRCGDLQQRLFDLLRFLCPITTSSIAITEGF
jgi:hypothetical protein